MDRSEIIGNALLMIMAGFHNTANTLGYLAYSLAQNPDIQKKLQDEIDEMMNTNVSFV